MDKKIKTKATITCPTCGFKREEQMPINVCQHFYKCLNCGEVLKPKDGDCCVFCSFADSKCPPKQLESKETV
jgi:DNA-directed RNA polymerase subunit RPC12/RpoP